MSGFKVEFSVLNLKATPGIYADAFANRPAAGYPGRVFIDTDNPSTGMYRDTGTVWVQIAETATSDVDTLQNVTDNGNTTTNSISVGHANTPVAIIDARTPFTNLNNADSFCVAANTARNITSNASFGVNYVNTVYGFQSLVFNGNATIGNGGINSAGNFINFLNNNTTGTVSVTQAATIRAIAGTQTGIYYNTGAASTVFTHVAAFKTLQPINTGSLPALVTNNYGLLVADNTANSGTITYTNRWGVYQEGASDKNYFAANVLIKSTTDNGNALQVTGNANITGNVGIGYTSMTSKLQVNGDIDIASGSHYKAGGVNALASDGSALYLKTGTQLYIQNNSSTNLGTITSTGNVGIGTTSPTTYTGFTTLALNNATNGGLLDFMNNGTVIGQINNTASSFEIGSSAVPFIFVTNGSERMRITSGGNLLVGGTSDNGLRLQVTGDIYANNEMYLDNGKYLRLQRSSGGLSTQALGIPSGTDDVRLLTTGDFNIVNGSLTNLMTIKNVGNVGINTTSPNASALLQMDSTTKGFLLPRMTDAQITAISNPPDGLMVYSTDQNHIAFWNAGAGVWKKVSNSNL